MMNTKPKAKTTRDQRLRGPGGKPLPHRSRLYGDLIPAYRALWPAVARRRILQNLRTMGMEPGSRVLEVGVGTGLSLESYPSDVTVTGIDLSETMLADAAERIERHGWQHITLRQMNAEVLEFADDEFDYVTSFHTISVVSNPVAMMREMVRVCRPGGKLLLINHFRSGNPWIARVVDSAGNFTRRLGWRTDLELDGLIRGMPVRLDQRSKSNPFSLFTVLKATVTDKASTAASGTGLVDVS